MLFPHPSELALLAAQGTNLFKGPILPLAWYDSYLCWSLEGQDRRFVAELADTDQMPDSNSS